MPGQRAFAEPEALEHLGPSSAASPDGRRLGLQLHAHADHLDVVAGVAELAGPAPRPRGSTSSSSSPTFTTASTRLLVSRKYGAQQVALLGVEPRTVERAALGERGVGRLQRGDLVGQRPVELGRLLAAGQLLLDGLEVGQGQLELDDPQVLERVRRAGHVAVLERPEHEHDRVDLADVRRGTGCRGPRPCSRPRPARRCRPPGPRRARRCGSSTSRPAGRAARRAPWPRRCWGPSWRTAYGAASAPPPVSALYSEDLPGVGEADEAEAFHTEGPRLPAARRGRRLGVPCAAMGYRRSGRCTVHRVHRDGGRGRGAG